MRLLVILSFLASASAFTAPRNLDFASIDTNSNGELDKKEIHALLDQDFQAGPRCEGHVLAARGPLPLHTEGPLRAERGVGVGPLGIV